MNNCVFDTGINLAKNCTGMILSDFYTLTFKLNPAYPSCQ